MTEKRTRLLFVVLVLGQLLAISARVPGADGEQSLAAGLWLRGVAPLAAAVDTVSDGVAQAAIYWTTRRRLLVENERLRLENEALRRQTVRDLGAVGDLQRLSRAVEYARSTGREVRLADVVYGDHRSWMRTFVVRLSGAGAELNQPVITDDGLVGRLVGISGRYAKVQLITDRAANIGVMVERTRRQGIVRGASADSLQLQFIPLQDDLQVGDRVVTAGIDGVYPRGIPVGTVTGVEPGDELFFEVEVAAAVDFRSVDSVYLLESEALPEDLRDPVLAPEDEP